MESIKTNRGYDENFFKDIKLINCNIEEINRQLDEISNPLILIPYQTDQIEPGFQASVIFKRSQNFFMSIKKYDDSIYHSYEELINDIYISTIEYRRVALNLGQSHDICIAISILWITLQFARKAGRLLDMSNGILEEIEQNIKDTANMILNGGGNVHKDYYFQSYYDNQLERLKRARNNLGDYDDRLVKTQIFPTEDSSVIKITLLSEGKVDTLSFERDPILLSESAQSFFSRFDGSKLHNMFTLSLNPLYNANIFYLNWLLRNTFVI